jgi:Zn-dependent protease
VESETLPAAAAPAAASTPQAPWKRAGSYLALAGLFFVKFKAIFISSFSFIASVGVYTLFWGWKFALVFTLLIFIHEMGHALFMKIYGVPGSLPYFIPGLGALITIKGRPASMLHESYIALGGPLVGSLGAAACLAYGWDAHNTFWIAAAYTGFFLNLFNLFPVLPLDGGRVAGSISPRIWLIGLVAMMGAVVALPWWNPFLLILVVLGAPRAIAAWRGPGGGTDGEAYHALTGGQRLGLAAAYFGLCAALYGAMLFTHLPQSAIS